MKQADKKEAVCMDNEKEKFTVVALAHNTVLCSHHVIDLYTLYRPERLCHFFTGDFCGIDSCNIADSVLCHERKISFGLEFIVFHTYCPCC